MNDLVGLPNNAVITVATPGTNLEIINHEVINPSGLLNWLIFAFGQDDSNHILSQMISQGFKLEGVIEHCIKELHNRSFLVDILSNFDSDDVRQYQIERHFKKDGTGGDIVSDFEIDLSTCKDWTDLYDLFKTDSVFHEEMTRNVALALAENQ